ncbi:MAG: ATP-dependent helicase [Gammaproteobacteria bacterium]
MDKYTVNRYIRGMSEAAYLSELNPEQRSAVLHGKAPLLVVAGAGTGKTRTLTHRVAHLVVSGHDPAAMMLLTFSRRAAAEMTRRARDIAATALRADNRHGAIALPFSGTFHALAHRFLREYATALGLDPDFTLMDRGDSADLLAVARQELKLAAGERRFPTKDTCLDVYSRSVNAQRPLQDTLAAVFPQHAHWLEELKRLFRRYVELKQEAHVLDFDDLLLYWFHMCQNPVLAAELSGRFEHIFVDEYQDTNRLQAGIILALRPDGAGITAVGDDAQAIYGFRCARVENMLEFEQQFEQPAQVLSLTQNYRSQPDVLALSNALMADAHSGFKKHLTCDREALGKPKLVRVADEDAQAIYVADAVLAAREKGVRLMDQAVLFRNAQHAHSLELELGRRDIPFVKYGGLRFLEAAHIKDFLALMRFACNPRERSAAQRLLLLIPGIGPVRAKRVWHAHQQSGFDLRHLGHAEMPAAAHETFAALAGKLAAIADGQMRWPESCASLLDWYLPLLKARYEASETRQGDLQHMCELAARYDDAASFLNAFTLDPPSATSDLAGPPKLDDDYLILSTVHSAKGLEWDNVFVLNVVDGTFPSEFACGDAALIEEERRLLYVAMTRAKNQLHLMHPLRFFVTHQPRLGSQHVFSAPSRFLTPALTELCESQYVGETATGVTTRGTAVVDVPGLVRDLW